LPGRASQQQSGGHSWGASAGVALMRQLEMFHGFLAPDTEPERARDIDHTQLVMRAQLEHLASVRRREQKEHDESAASERIVEMQIQMTKLADTASSSAQLLLQTRNELLNQRASSQFAWSNFRERFDAIESRIGAEDSLPSVGPPTSPSPRPQAEAAPAARPTTLPVTSSSTSRPESEPIPEAEESPSIQQPPEMEEACTDPSPLPEPESQRGIDTSGSAAGETPSEEHV